MITIAVSYQPFGLYLQGGAWLVAYRAEQRRRFKAVICGGDPILQRQSAVTKLQSDDIDYIEEERPQKLDGFFLVSLWVFLRSQLWMYYWYGVQTSNGYRVILSWRLKKGT